MHFVTSTLNCVNCVFVCVLLIFFFFFFVCSNWLLFLIFFVNRHILIISIGFSFNILNISNRRRLVFNQIFKIVLHKCVYCVIFMCLFVCVCKATICTLVQPVKSEKLKTKTCNLAHQFRMIFLLLLLLIIKHT